MIMVKKRIKKENPKNKVIKEKKINEEKDLLAEKIEDSEEIYGITVGDEDETESEIS